uniref:Peptidase S1 domain-containing protein n=1 Tax=Anopheles atroparvus TaxID=41427 RepID=A0AAG5D2D1_ANOAO
MAAELLSLIVIELLFLVCFISASSQIIRNYGQIKKLEGEKCRTAYIDDGVCIKQEDCDQAFLNSLPFEDHTDVCRHNAKYKVLCCQPFMDFCNNKKYQHIWGGGAAEPGSFPQLARIGDHIGNRIQWKCSSSIISDQFLLTAAHCLSADVAGFGCISAEQCDQQINVKKFMPHPNYKKGKKYDDIALIQLAAAIQFKKHVLPVCPYPRLDDLPQASNLTVAGWGATESEIFSSTLRFAQFHTVSREECRESFSALPKSLLQTKLHKGIINEMYCAKGSFNSTMGWTSDACQGDSGGPLLGEDGKNVFLVGVVSTGIGCGSGFPGIYTRVGAYFDWINGTVHNFTQFT